VEFHLQAVVKNWYVVIEGVEGCKR
jgi:hypothetical protein